MPTGYTSVIKDGITFEDFAMRCARAFGALIDMRDEPMDAPIPDKVKISSYNQTALNNANKKLIKISAMTLPQCLTESQKEYKAQVALYQKYQADEKALKAKYDAMLDKVNAWTPPTAEHNGLKKFMKEQIQESIRFDCTDYYTRQLELLVPLSATEWKAKQIDQIKNEITYHTKDLQEEIQRTKERADWIKQLKKSLNLKK